MVLMVLSNSKNTENAICQITFMMEFKMENFSITEKQEGLSDTLSGAESLYYRKIFDMVLYLT